MLFLCWKADMSKKYNFMGIHFKGSAANIKTLSSNQHNIFTGS
jgi:hypothetical protein